MKSVRTMLVALLKLVKRAYRWFEESGKSDLGTYDDFVYETEVIFLTADGLGERQ